MSDYFDEDGFLVPENLINDYFGLIRDHCGELHTPNFEKMRAVNLEKAEKLWDDFLQKLAEEEA